MPSPPASLPAGPSALEAAALQHAIRCWEAEVENARRLGTRVQVLLSLATALLGVLFLRGGDAAAVDPVALRWPLILLLAASSSLIFQALVILLRPRARSRAHPLAAHWMSWPRTAGMDPRRLDAEMARSLCWERTVQAAAVLQRANAAKQRDVDRGQTFVLLGTGATLLGFLAHLIAAGAVGGA